MSEIVELMNLSEFELRQRISELGNSSQGDEVAISTLLDLLQANRDEITNWSILRALAKIAAGHDRTIQHLLGLLQTGRPPSKVIASEVLQKIAIGNEAAIAFLIENMANTTDENFAQVAAVIIEKISRDSSFASQTLINLIYNNTDPKIRELSIKIICQIDLGSKEGIDAILHILKTGEGFTQRVQEYLAVKAVGNIEVIACLKRMIRTSGEDPLISNARTFAARALMEVNRSPNVPNPSYNRSRVGIPMQEVITTKAEYLSSINNDVINDYLELIKIGNSDDHSIAVYNLIDIGKGNNDVFEALVHLLESSQDDYLRRLLIPGLSKISLGVSEEKKRTGIEIVRNQIKICQSSFEKAQLAGLLGSLGGANQETIDMLEQIREQGVNANRERLQQITQRMQESGLSEEQISDALASRSSNLSIEQSAAIYNLGLIQGEVNGIGVLLDRLKNITNHEELPTILVALRKNGSDHPEVFEALCEVVRTAISPDLYGMAIWGLVEMGDDKPEVVNLMNDAIASHPNPFEVLMVRAGIYEQRQQLDQALEDCDRAISLNTEDASPWFIKSKIFFDQARYQESIAANQQLLAFFPEDWSVWYNIACCYSRQNQLQQAIEALGRAIAIAPLEVKPAALDDPDLESLSAMPEFQKLINQD